MKKYLLFAFLFICFLNPNIEAQVLFDHWPTIETNDRSQIKDKKLIQPLYNLIGREWDHRIITYFFENSTTDIPVNDQRQAIRDGLALWSEVTDIAFLEVCNANEADIVFLWGILDHGDPNPICYPEWGLGPFDGINGVLAHSMGGPGPNDCGNQAGDIHFDDDERWTLDFRNNELQDIDLFTVAAHEIGHSLGLFHTAVAGSLMEAFYTGSQRFLGIDDISGIRSIYGLPGSQSISGPDLLCSSSPYTLDDVPAGSTVTWSAAPAFLFTNTSGSGNTFTTAPASINGQGTITATVTGTCGATSISRNIQVGPPTGINGLSQNQIICDNQYINLTSEFGYLSYNWTVLGGTVVSGQGTAQVTVLTDNNPFQGYNMISVRLNVTSTCMDGTNEITAYVNNCGGSPIDPMIYPNPASDEMTVELNHIDEGVRKEEKMVELSLFDYRGTELYKQTTSEDKVVLNVRHLKNGFYYLHIRYEEALIRKQIRVER